MTLQGIVDYVQYDRYALVNRETGFIMILIICNSTIGYPGGYERSYWLRTPELAIQRYSIPSACTRLLGTSPINGRGHAALKGCFCMSGMHRMPGSLWHALHLSAIQ